MQDKKGDYTFVYGWNNKVKKFDHCTYHVNLPSNFEGGLNMIPSGLNHTSAILAYNNEFNYDKDKWYIMDNEIMKTLKKESSYKSKWYDILMPRVNHQETQLKIMYIANENIGPNGSNFTFEFDRMLTW